MPEKKQPKHSSIDTNRPLKVLVAEDHVVNQEVIKAILKLQGLEFKIVENGMQVIESLAQERFDVILMDMQMPVMDGCQATKEIRQQEQVSGDHIRIVAITANARQQDKDSCFAAGMDDYITKPIDPQQLILKLQTSFLSSDHTMPLDDHVEILRNEDTVFNAESLIGRVLGQTVPSVKMAQMFKRELPNTLMNLEAALKAGDINEIARLAHRFSGAAAMLGAEQVALIAQEMEEDALVGSIKTLPGLMTKMHQASIPLLKQLKEFLNQY